MITKREKLQYIYVFLTDLVVLLLSTLLAWLVTDGLLKQLVPYAPRLGADHLPADAGLCSDVHLF